MVAMKKQVIVQPRKRGPKPTGKGTPIQVRLQAPALDEIDQWRRREKDVPTRPEAIRRLVKLGLGRRLTGEQLK